MIHCKQQPSPRHIVHCYEWLLQAVTISTAHSLLSLTRCPIQKLARLWSLIERQAAKTSNNSSPPSLLPPFPPPPPPSPAPAPQPPLRPPPAPLTQSKLYDPFCYQFLCAPLFTGPAHSVLYSNRQPYGPTKVTRRPRVSKTWKTYRLTLRICCCCWRFALPASSSFKTESSCLRRWLDN